MKFFDFLAATALAAILCVPTMAQAQSVSSVGAVAANWQAATMPQAKQILLPSKQTGRTYRIQTLAVGEAPAQGYQIVFVLDGEMMFPTASTAAYTYFNHARDNGAKPLLVVGIGYDNGQLLDIPMRSLDYTPPMLAKGKIAPSLPPKGEADLFLNMIEQELLPQLQQTYRIHAQKSAILGHSYGGVLALYALMQRPEMFSHYIVSSPSMWWNEGSLQHLPDSYFKPLLQNKQLKKVRLSVGEYEQAPSPHVDANGERAQILAQKQMVNKIEDMGARLQGLQAVHLQLQQARYAGETHTGAMFRATLDGIKFLYQD